MLPIFIRLSAAGILLLAAVVPAAAEPPGGTPPALDFSGLIAAAQIKGPFDFCGEPVPLDDPEVRERVEREILSILADPPQVILWIKRSRRVLAPIEQQLSLHGLPADLKYIAVVESALRPHAGSSKGAMGFWQFLPVTGRKYGLQVDNEKDMRRNLYASTAAAIAYLQQLHEMFGSWTLAAAAFNMGEHGLERDIREQKTRDYYRLYLSLETQRYIFRVLAAKLILQSPEKYGFQLQPEDIYPQTPCERIVFDLGRETPILAVAQAANTDVKAIKDLNPEIRGFRLAAGRHSLTIPLGSAQGFQERLAAASQQLEEQRSEIVYVVKAGDSLGKIAESHGVSISEIEDWNRLDARKPIQPGMRLRILTPEEINGDSGAQ